MEGKEAVYKTQPEEDLEWRQREYARKVVLALKESFILTRFGIELRDADVASTVDRSLFGELVNGKNVKLFRRRDANSVPAVIRQAFLAVAVVAFAPTLGYKTVVYGNWAGEESETALIPVSREVSGVKGGNVTAFILEPGVPCLWVSSTVGHSVGYIPFWHIQGRASYRQSDPIKARSLILKDQTSNERNVPRKKVYMERYDPAGQRATDAEIEFWNGFKERVELNLDVEVVMSGILTQSVLPANSQLGGLFCYLFSELRPQGKASPRLVEPTQTLDKYVKTLIPEYNRRFPLSKVSPSGPLTQEMVDWLLERTAMRLPRTPERVSFDLKDDGPVVKAVETLMDKSYPSDFHAIYRSDEKGGFVYLYAYTEGENSNVRPPETAFSRATTGATDRVDVAQGLEFDPEDGSGYRYKLVLSGEDRTVPSVIVSTKSGGLSLEKHADEILYNYDTTLSLKGDNQ